MLDPLNSEKDEDLNDALLIPENDAHKHIYCFAHYRSRLSALLLVVALFNVAWSLISYRWSLKMLREMESGGAKSKRALRHKDDGGTVTHR